jgi:hypothetical protein
MGIRCYRKQMPPTVRRLVGPFAVCATSPFGKPPCVPVGWSRFSRCPDADCILLPSAIRWNGPKVLERNQSLKNRFVLSGQQEFLWQESTRRHTPKVGPMQNAGDACLHFCTAWRGPQWHFILTSISLGNNSQRSARRAPLILLSLTLEFPRPIAVRGLGYADDGRKGQSLRTIARL